jgi:hypothetical protein
MIASTYPGPTETRDQSPLDRVLALCVAFWELFSFSRMGYRPVLGAASQVAHCVASEHDTVVGKTTPTVAFRLYMAFLQWRATAC